MITSLICSGLSPARSTAARMATAPRSLALRAEKQPSSAPMGVRTALRITISSVLLIAAVSSGSKNKAQAPIITDAARPPAAATLGGHTQDGPYMTVKQGSGRQAHV